jgi:hypothetical protein
MGWGGGGLLGSGLARATSQKVVPPDLDGRNVIFLPWLSSSSGRIRSSADRGPRGPEHALSTTSGRWLYRGE